MVSGSIMGKNGSLNTSKDPYPSVSGLVQKVDITKLSKYTKFA